MLRNSLIATQVAISLVLLAAGALFIRTLRNLKAVDTGFSADKVLTVGIAPHRMAGPPQEADLAIRLIERASAIPGVQSASVAVNATLGFSGSGVNGLEIEGYTPKNPDDRRARANWVGPRYFETLGIPLLHGREFSMVDTLNSAGVVIVNQTMARYYFGDESALGRRIRFNKRDYEIVGVVRDAKYRELRESTPRMLFFAFLQNPAGVSNLEVRTAGAALPLAETVRKVVREVEPNLDAFDVTTLSKRIDQKLTPEYLVADISGFFSSLTLLLVCIGIYGTLAYAVAGRTNEIGLRMALGARRTSVVFMILRDILWTLLAGIAAGVVGILAVGRLVASVLFQVTPRDPGTIGFAVLLVTLVALLAGYIPARRASRLDPVGALRLD
jgi:predicted permease